MTGLYLDNNATTPLLPAAGAAMLACPAGNPASAHAAGRRARRALEDAREHLASLLHAHPDEVVFTSGATEANNLALLGLAGPDGHLIASPIEHPSVSEPLAALAETGHTLQMLPVNRAGLVPAELPPLRPETRLLAIMLANHETGALQPVQALAHSTAVPFHTDATQAVGKIEVNFHALGVTTLACSAHKFHGPAGIGALLVRRGTRLRPLTRGGHQQQGRRPGTEPVALVVGMAAALDAACREREARWEHVCALRRALLGHLARRAAPLAVNGSPEGLPHTLNVSFPGVRADALLMALDLAGVQCSAGSACSSGSLLPSPVLRAMGVADELLHSAIRLSLSPLLTLADVEEAGCLIANVVNRLRHALPPA